MRIDLVEDMGRMAFWYTDGVLVHGWRLGLWMASWFMDGVLVHGWRLGSWMAFWFMDGVLVV